MPSNNLKRIMAREYQRCSKTQKLDNSVSGTATFKHISDHHRETITTKISTNREMKAPTIPPLAPLPPSRDMNFFEESNEDEAFDGDEPTQTRAVIDSFMEQEARIQSLIMNRYENPYSNETCSCKRGLRLVRCRWDGCFQYPISCENCFVDQHRYNPFHWALVWSKEKGFWEKKDYSKLLGDTVCIQLGHSEGSRRCTGSSPLKFKITHTNGVHVTRVNFCGCPKVEQEKLDQLISSDLFPATTKDPHSAFTISLLKQFRMHNLQSKCGAFDYITAIRRLTNNTSTNTVPDPYKSFLRVSRVWDTLQLKRWMGVSFGIERLLPTRSNNILNVYCPSCPEPGINMPLVPQALPEDLRHVSSIYFTLDGNHHANRYSKNTDPTDVSLFKGMGYFPDVNEYKAYAEKTANTKEKCQCTYLSVVMNQDRKKFRGNDETGLINFQCNHVYVLASTDMYLGERHAYVDYVIDRGANTRSLDGINVFISYDAACSLAVNILHRFREHFPRSKDTIERAKFSIDALHINDHLDRCTYLYGACYQECTGHFHGVGTEQYWSENNQMGPQTRQMNPGHRHDKIINHHSEWNWKKTGRHAATTAKDLTLAWSLYVENHDHLKKLTAASMKYIPEWYRMSKEPEITRDGEVKSVYRHISAKGMSIDSLNDNFTKLMDTPRNLSRKPSAYFLKEGLCIEAKQFKMIQLKSFYTTHKLLATKNELDLITSDIEKRLERWRNLQANFMPTVRDHVLAQPSVPIESETLFLPSHFSSELRKEMNLEALGAEEFQLREAEIFECIMQLRQYSMHLSYMNNQKKKDTQAQRNSSRSSTRRKTVEKNQDCLLKIYNTARAALLNFSVDTEAVLHQFPALSVDDLERKSTADKRQQGDSRRSEGKLWTTGVPKSHLPSYLTQSTSMPQTTDSPLDTVSTSLASSSMVLDGPSADNSGLWSPTIGLSDIEREAWDSEHDRVQWFRAWANTMRWLEEFELKHVEFMRSVQYFDTMREVWGQLAVEADHEGITSFCKRQSCLFDSLRENTKAWFNRVAEPRFVNITEENIVSVLRDFREHELGWLATYTTPIQ